MTLGIGIAEIGLQIRTRRLGIKLYANFGKFGCIISVKNNQLACQNPLEVSSLSRIFLISDLKFGTYTTIALI